MNDILQHFIVETHTRFKGRLCSTDKLFGDCAAKEELLDTAVVGGYGLQDILAGRVNDSEIPPIIKEAFHAQYPHAGSFATFVREHHGDSALLGIISGIKGKAFELGYLDYLNDGHLPAGAVAELASSPTQEGWDIAIRDSSGHVIKYLQLKATENLSYIKEAIAQHPEIDVVLTHEVFEQLHDPETLSHVIDSGILNLQFEEAASDSLNHVAPEFDLVPWLAFGMIAIQSWQTYKAGSPLSAVVNRAYRRGAYATASRGMSYLTILLSQEPFVGLATSILVRLGLGRYDAQRQLVEFIKECREAQRARLDAFEVAS